MEDFSMFLGELKQKIDEKSKVPLPPKFGREPTEGVLLTPGVEKYITTYPLAEWKKLAVCNFLVRMRCNGFMSEPRQLDNSSGTSRSGRF